MQKLNSSFSLFFGAFVFLCASQTFANDAPRYIHESRRNASKRVLIVGDSITVSNCTLSSDGMCGWRKALARECGASAEAFTYDTVSQVGHTAFEAGRALPASFSGVSVPFVARNHYDAAFVMLGVNDIAGGGTSPSALASSYVHLLTSPPQAGNVLALRSALTAAGGALFAASELTEPYQNLLHALDEHSDTAETRLAYSLLLDAMQTRILKQVDLGVLAESYKRLFEKLKGLDIAQIYWVSVLPTCRFGEAVRPFANLKIRKANEFLKDLSATDPAAHYLNIYDSLVESKQSVAAQGCLRSDIVSTDHLHPKRDDATQAAIAQPIARALSLIAGNSLGCEARASGPRGLE